MSKLSSILGKILLVVAVVLLPSDVLARYSGDYFEIGSGGPVNDHTIYGQKLLYLFDSSPVADIGSYSFFSGDLRRFRNQGILDIENDNSNFSLPNLLAPSVWGTFHRLEDIMYATLSYKPTEHTFNKMKDRNSLKYEGADDSFRGVTDSADYYVPGIRQGIFMSGYYGNDYTTLDKYKMSFIDRLNFMTDYREYARPLRQEGQPLELAGWFEGKFLLTVGSDRPRDVEIMQKRRNSFLQESIIDAMSSAAFIQIKMLETVDYIGRPNDVDSKKDDGVNFMTTLVGDFTTAKADAEGNVKFVSSVYKPVFKGKGFSVADADINSAIKSNFVARHTFSQLLSVYQQALSARLKLLVATSTASTKDRRKGTLVTDYDGKQRFVGPIGKFVIEQEKERKRKEEAEARAKANAEKANKGKTPRH